MTRVDGVASGAGDDALDGDAPIVSVAARLVGFADRRVGGRRSSSLTSVIPIPLLGCRCVSASSIGRGYDETRPMHGAPRLRLSRRVRARVVNMSVAWLWLLFAASNIAVWRQGGGPVGVPLAATEIVAAVLFVVRRPSKEVGSPPFAAWIAGTVGTCAPLLLRPTLHVGTELSDAFLAIQFGGALFAISSLLLLGRSFGIVADNRGPRTHGLYGVVRHPLYASYLVISLGFSAENVTFWNFAVTVATAATMVWRIRWEERCLLADATYRQYAAGVRWRLLPLVY
jgi:protein-S-isoprenylcysteine O-methyltransferase Ste14